MRIPTPIWGERKEETFQRKVGKGTENRKNTEKYVNTKAAGIVLRVAWLRMAWLRLHGPYTLHRGHPDVRKGRAGRRGEDSAGDRDRRQLAQIARHCPGRSRDYGEWLVMV